MYGILRRCPVHLAYSTQLSLSGPVTSRSAVFSPPGSYIHRCILKPIVPSRSFHQFQRWQAAAATARTGTTPGDDGSEAIPSKFSRFQDLATQKLVSTVVIDTITSDFKFENMSEVQSATINEALKGTDMLVPQPYD
jgi:ATP-dependent RNA helicase MSS116, mitochondrial